MTSKEIVIRKLESFNEYVKLEKSENRRVSLYTKKEIEYLENLLKELQRLENQDIIIKLLISKGVDITAVKATSNYIEYNCFTENYAIELTEEEFIKIKEWVKCY